MNRRGEGPGRADEELLRRWYAVSSGVRRAPALELLARADRAKRARSGRRRSLAMAAVVAAAVLVAVIVAGTWMAPRPGPAASPGSPVPSTPSATSSASLPGLTPTPSAVGLPGPALAAGETVVQMDRTPTGGWLLTPVRLLTTDGRSWRDCWLSGSPISHSRPFMSAALTGGVVHVQMSAEMWTSTNDCASWSKVALPVDPMSMVFLTKDLGFIAGTDNHLSNPRSPVYRTTDSGANWTRVGAIAASYATLSFADAEHGFAADQTQLFSTSNGGRTWSEIALPRPASVQGQVASVLGPVAAGDGRAAVVVKYDATPQMGDAPGGQVIYRTVDFGAHWTVASILDDPGSLEFSLVDSRTWVVVDPSEVSTVRSTEDSGATWQTVAVRDRWPFTAESIDFDDAQHGWLVVVEPYPPCAQGSGSPLPFCEQLRPASEELAITNDGGATWAAVP